MTRDQPPRSICPKRLLIALAVAASLASVAAIPARAIAQPLEDVVYLKNGSILRGMILELVPNQTIKLRIAGGSLFVLRFDEIVKYAKEPAAPERAPAAAGPAAGPLSYALSVGAAFGLKWATTNFDEVVTIGGSVGDRGSKRAVGIPIDFSAGVAFGRGDGDEHFLGLGLRPTFWRGSSVSFTVVDVMLLKYRGNLGRFMGGAALGIATGSGSTAFAFQLQMGLAFPLARNISLAVSLLDLTEYAAGGVQMDLGLTFGPSFSLAF